MRQLLALSVMSLCVNALALDPSKGHHRGDRGSPSLRYVYANQDGSFTMAGNMSDVDVAKDLKKKHGSRFLYARYQGDEYVVTDKALLAQFEKTVEKQRALGEEQGKLGDKQGKLGEEQGKLGEKMGAIGEQIGRAALAGDDVKVRELEREMKKLQKEQEKYEAPQRELAKEQEKLGAQQEKLGKEVEAEVSKLIAEAVTSGKATKL